MDMDKEIHPVNQIYGEIRVPGDKPISHRVAIISSIAKGPTEMVNFHEGRKCST
jgi:5-enolpyruvylshikimate-3-phosphate synthase